MTDQANEKPVLDRPAPAAESQNVVPVNIDSAAFAACMLTVRIPSICARVAAAMSARAAQRDSTPEGVVL